MTATRPGYGAATSHRTFSDASVTSPKLEEGEIDGEWLSLPAVSRYERPPGPSAEATAAAGTGPTRHSDSSGSSDSDVPTAERGLLKRKMKAQASRLPPWVLRWSTWLAGPSPPIQLQPRSFALETAAEKRLERATRLFRCAPWLLFHALFLAGWLVCMALLTRESWFSATTEEGAPSLIGTSTSFWKRNDECGLDGSSCAPFNDSYLAFRCPASSDSVKLLNQRAVGSQELIFQKLLVGGGDDESTYRADSWICSAALQQGLISSTYGGCGVARQVGSFSDYRALKENGLQSVSFDSEFPSAYRLDQSSGSHCKDLKFVILAVNIVLLFLFTLLFRPLAKLFFWVAACVGFWHIALTSSGPPSISTAFGTFLPCCFILFGIWVSSSQYVLPVFNSLTLERAFLFGFFFWLGTLMDMTVESWVPVDRLTAEDINRQPGGLVAVVILVLVVAACALAQLWAIRKTGWLLFYLKWYAVGGIVLGILSALPDLQLRLHHYITALILLPLTGIPTRISLVFQAFLLGMFLNGAALWGFDSVLQTADELRRDAPLGSDLPSFNVTDTVEASLVTWDAIPDSLQDSWDSFALIANDVLRYVGNATSFNVTTLSLPDGLPLYLRLAYRQGDTAGDFTKAATLFSNGTWLSPANGPS